MEFSQNAFSAPLRTLTGLGGALVTQSTPTSTIAAASTLAFNQVANVVSTNNVAAIAAAGGSVVINFTDGTNTWTATTIAAGATGGQTGLVSCNTVAWQVHNNAPATAAVVWWCGYVLQT